MSTLVRSMSTALVICLLLVFARGAEAQVEPTPAPIAPAVEVGPHDPAYLERVELAGRSLAGPSLEMASGIGLISVAGALNLVALLALLLDGDELSGGVAFGASLAVIGGGIGMTWHGAKRIGRIKAARRALAFEGVALGRSAQGGQASLRFAF